MCRSRLFILFISASQHNTVLGLSSLNAFKRGFQAPALIEKLLRKKKTLDCIQRCFQQRGYKMTFQYRPNNKATNPWQCGPLVAKQAVFGYVKQKFTIFCRSKVFPPQCGPRNAGKGSPWEWRECALEMKETLKKTEHLISMASHFCTNTIILEPVEKSLVLQMMGRGDQHNASVCMFNTPLQPAAGRFSSA